MQLLKFFIFFMYLCIENISFSSTYSRVNSFSDEVSLSRIVPQTTASIVDQLINWGNNYNIDLYVVIKNENSLDFDSRNYNEADGNAFGIKKHSVCWGNTNRARPYIANELKPYLKSLRDPLDAQEAITALTNFPLDYLQNVWIGLSWLPMSVQRLLKYKSFYFTKSVGQSRTIYGSFDHPHLRNRGLTSGIFVEDNPNRPLIRNTIVHEIGHLIDWNVLIPQAYEIDPNTAQPWPTKMFYCQYKILQEFSRQEQKDVLFTGTSDAIKLGYKNAYAEDRLNSSNILSIDVNGSIPSFDEWKRIKGKTDQEFQEYLSSFDSYTRQEDQSIRDYGVSKVRGFLTGKSEQSKFEDFADHFCAFIFERCIHDFLIVESSNLADIQPATEIGCSHILLRDEIHARSFWDKSISEKNNGDNTLYKKYIFFEEMLALFDEGDIPPV